MSSGKLECDIFRIALRSRVVAFSGELGLLRIDNKRKPDWSKEDAESNQVRAWFWVLADCSANSNRIHIINFVTLV